MHSLDDKRAAFNKLFSAWIYDDEDIQNIRAISKLLQVYACYIHEPLWGCPRSPKAKLNEE